MAVSLDRSNADFAYPKLDEQLQEVRLFTFHGFDELGLLHGRLSTVSLQDHVEFDALSYEWGDDSPDKPVMINDYSFKIRKNLHSFLSTVAKHGGLKRPMFIDALCIDQGNRAERSSQVRLMPEIYTKAHEVRAWLGPLPAWWTSSPDLSDLWSTVEFREMGNFMYYLLSIRQPSQPLRFTIKRMTEWAKNSGLDNLTIIAARVAAQRFFWQRLWIVQEIMLAKKMRFQLGDQFVEPDVLHQVSRVFSIYDEMHKTSTSIVRHPLVGSQKDAISDGLRFQDAGFILSTKYDSSQAEQLPLHEVLGTFAVQQCREPRDHIFGLLGLASSAIQPDYDLPLTQLFTYALIEGCSEVQNDPSANYRQGTVKVWSAIMEAFGWRMSDPGIHMITKIALDEPDYRILLLTLWNTSYSLDQKNWPRIIRWTLEALQLILLVIIPTRLWSMLYIDSAKGTPMVYAYGPMFAAYGAQTVMLSLLQSFDCDIATPDGQVRTYSEWRQEVRRIAALVRERKPPTSPPVQDVAPCDSARPTKSNATTRALRIRWRNRACALVRIIAWVLGGAFPAFLAYFAYDSGKELFVPIIRSSVPWSSMPNVIPSWMPSWKTGLAVYLCVYMIYRITGFQRTMEDASERVMPS